MKKATLLLFIAIILNACDTFGAQPQPFPIWSPIPSRTPGVVTATPIILPPSFTETSTATINAATDTPSPTLSPTAAAPSDTATPPPVQSIQVDILGCNTSLDITHGMGEVTNAYVMVKNTGTAGLPNTCALLRAIDEDREHPDKEVCLSSLPENNQVTLKLTVDSAYRQDTAIQVDISSNDALLLRVDKPACTDISFFGGVPSDIGVVKPIIP